MYFFKAYLHKSYRNIGVSLVLVLTYLIAPPANATFEKAMEIYKEGRFVEAKAAFEALAAIGDSSSLFNLGVMHFRGESVDYDPVRAYVFMKIANEGSNDDAFSKTSQAVFLKLGDNQKQEADKLYNAMSDIYGRESIAENIFPTLLDDKDCAPDLMPIRRGKPVYPRSELRNGKMGLVHTEFTVSPEGYPREINVTSSTSRAFTKATIKGLNSYLYPPTPNKMPKGEQHVSVYKFDVDGNEKIRTKAIVRELEDLRTKSESGDVVAQFLYGRRLNTYRYFKSFFKARKFQYREANEWYMKSASGGVIQAQYEIGRNMLEGRGCEVDKENGFKWMKAAAVGGYSPAQKYLATSELSNTATTKNKARSIMSWLRNAAQDEKYNYPSKLLLAWELVTSPEKSLLDAEEALTLLKDPPYTYSDDLRILETKAAAFAVKNNFKKAIKLQQKAYKLAQAKKWEIPRISERLNLYKKNQTYIGTYY